MRGDPTRDGKLRAEAAEWVATLHASVPSSPSEAREYETNCRRFIEWVSLSAAHVEVFLRADDTFCRLAGLQTFRHAEREEFCKPYLPHNEDPIGTFSSQLEQPTRWFHGRTLLALAASLLLIVAGAGPFAMLTHSHEYATAVGMQLNVKLPDGSLMLLNTKSRARFAFSAEQRLVYLSEGEALFEVEHELKRPFIVVTPTARVLAVGTRFNVYQHPEDARAGDDATTVSVLDGVVQIAPQIHALASSVSEASALRPQVPDSVDRQEPPARLAAGEQARISRSGVTRKTTPNVVDAVAWRDRVLVFQGTSIAEVAAEYNRYNTSQVRIEDKDIGQRQLSGTYSADRPETLVRYIEEAFQVPVTRAGNDWVVGRR
jgi:transmembrane sensor